jgi:hypothetical protein
VKTFQVRRWNSFENLKQSKEEHDPTNGSEKKSHKRPSKENKVSSGLARTLASWKRFTLLVITVERSGHQCTHQWRLAILAGAVGYTK